MNKTEIVDTISERLELAKNKANDTFDLIFDMIKDAVADGARVNIPGFGIFDKRERSARTGRNPQTGAPIQIAATSVPGFKASQNFKDKVSDKS